VVLALCNIGCNIDTRDGAKAEIVSQIIAAERTQDFVPKEIKTATLHIIQLLKET